jgi:hypothetical protein
LILLLLLPPPCRELASCLWGCATLGAAPAAPASLQALARAAAQQLPGMPLHEAITCAWALYTLDQVRARV